MKRFLGFVAVMFLAAVLSSQALIPASTASDDHAEDSWIRMFDERSIQGM